MKDSKIEWTDHTFNPWWGCTKVSPACDNCYAAALDKRTGGNHWGVGVERRRTSPANWAQPAKWNKNHDAFFKEHGRRQRVFCASMADVFDNEVDPQWRADLFALIAETPNLDWLLLTKRIGNARALIAQATAIVEFNDTSIKPYTSKEPWLNVWIGATICNQAEADRDIPKLLATPAAKRFLSIEPMLGAIDISAFLPNLDWVIVGGECGSNARPMHPDWVGSLRDQCSVAEVSFFFKQWGEYRSLIWSDGGDIFIGENKGYKTVELDCSTMVRYGKKSAGRLLDGVECNGVPA